MRDISRRDGRFRRADLPWAGVFAIVLAAATALPAQQLPGLEVEEDASSRAESDVIHLSPFEVNSADDTGYRSSNSTSATSLNMAIKDIPMSIEVINQEFIEDTGAIDFDETLRYSAGVVLNDYAFGPDSGVFGNNGPGANETESNDISASSRGGLNGLFSNAINLRGFNIPFQNRDGFRYGGQIANFGIVLGGFVDTVNIRRIEVVRGPNSLLYGIGVLSGITNMIPKRPLSETAGSASLSFGNFDYRRATVDWTAPLTKDLWGGVLSYRVATAQTHRGHWTDFRQSDIQYYVGQLQFTNPQWTVFLEGQYANQKESGIGAQFVYDNLDASTDPSWRNPYGEKWNWQKEWLGLPQTTRITGPDTYDRHEEYDILFNADYSPIDNLTLSAGAFFTDIQEDEFNVNISTMTNEESGLNFKGVVLQRLLAAERAAAKNPANWNPGEGELAAQAPYLRNWFDTYVWVRDSPEKKYQGANDPRDLTDYRYVRYWWRKTPKTSTTQQYRLRGTYSFETADLFGDARGLHTLLGGFHYIHDEADFTWFADRISRNYAAKAELAVGDPLLERNIFDPAPIRYNGEALAIPGYRMPHADVWYKGLYALYQGRWLDERLGLVAGLRWDEYHMKYFAYDRFNEYEFIGNEHPYGPDYDGPPVYAAPSTEVWHNPDSETFGILEGSTVYSPGPNPESAITKTLAVNYRISPALTVYGLRAEGLTPNIGVLDGNNDAISSERSTSAEIGLKFDLLEGKLSGTAAVYRIRRENALWGFGAAPKPATWVGHPNPFPWDPPDPGTHFVPGLVENGTYPISYGVHAYYFKQDGFELGPIETINYDDEGNYIGRTIGFPEGYIGKLSGNHSEYGFFQYDKLDEPAVDRYGNTNGRTWRHYLEAAFADRDRHDTPYYYSADLRGGEKFDPIHYGRVEDEDFAMHPGIGRGAPVTYTDVANGWDLQLLYQPTPSWEMVFTYAHTQRSVEGTFSLAEIVNPETGFQFGTEYDPWVRVLGRKAFGLEEHDDDGDGVVDRVTKQGHNEVLKLGDVPTSSLVGGLEGISLYTGPEEAFSLFQKYTFLEDSLNGLAVNLGLTYTGLAQTSIPIGGSDLAENLYGTPPTPDRWNVNLGFSYRWKWGDQRYTARLHINNLLDDQKGETVVEYTDPEGRIIPRRITRYYEPRSIRLGFSVHF